MKQATVPCDKHLALFGETQSGKTTLGNRIAQNFQDHGVLFIDLEDMNEIESTERYDKDSDLENLRDDLGQGKTVRYVPDAWDKDTRKEEIKVLAKKLIFEWNIPVYVFADEIQEYGDSSSSPFDVFAVRGLKRGVHLVAITQRPAKLSKTIATQTDTFIFFEVGEFERGYFQAYNLPFEPLIQRFQNLSGDYWFLVYSRNSGLSQPLKLNLS